MSKVSLSGDLCNNTLARIVERLQLTEVCGEEGGPHKVLLSHAPVAEGPVGDVRVFKGDRIRQLVKVTIAVPQIFLDSHMIFAFTDGDSPVPHFTLDSVEAGEHFAFHLDLIPKMDLGACAPYMNEVFHPLTPLFEEANSIEGLSLAELSPRQFAIMSPWMMAKRASESAFREIEASVNKYLDHWFSVLESGVSDAATSGVTPEAFAARDKANREMIFSSEIDPVWNRIQGLLGEEMVNYQQQLLRGEIEL